MQDNVIEAKELQIWWEMRDKYIEQLEEYVNEELEKDRKDRNKKASKTGSDEL